MDSTQKLFQDGTGGILRPEPANGYPRLYLVKLPDGNNLVRLPGDESIESIFWKDELEKALTEALQLTLPEALICQTSLVPEIAKALHRFRKEKP